MPNPGTRIGRYEIRSPLGAGGMGEVFLAWDRDLEREVAVKVLRGEVDADRTKRFVQEAKAASGLHHPNVAHVYEIGSQDDLQFIAMEFVRGETLRARLRRGALPQGELLDLATQIAAGLGAAHRAGIVHRDIKPENVIVTPDGYAKVLDFGLAKLREARGEDAATILRTTPGVAMGTLPYMAPEQFTGGEITPATDVYSFGVMLHEMAVGTRPGEGGRAEGALAPVIAKALQKNPEDRYRDANEIVAALRAIAPRPATKSRAIPIAAGIAIVAFLVAVAWFAVRQNRINAANSRIEAASKLVKDRQLTRAYDATMLAAAVLPDDPRVTDLIAQTSGKATFESDPSGATIYLQTVDGPAQRQRMGMTPLTLLRLPRADYLLTVEKTGYAPVTRPISHMPLYENGEAFLSPLSVRVKLAPTSNTPPAMVLVEGAPYRLAGYQRPSDRLVELRDFFIDRFEVSNRDFEAFVRDGGYRRKELWKHRFVDGGKTLSFDEAMARFRDTTGLPGPRGWSGGLPPRGMETHPVTGVTWYEAAAFAEWKGKKLPTIYQWERAARPDVDSTVGTTFPWGLVGQGMEATDRANFLGKGTMPVDSMPAGAGPFGALHMAGNVWEWCRNPNPPGFAARGGGWSDNVYSFGATAAYPPFYSSPALGFRCASGGEGDEGDFALDVKGFAPDYEPIDDARWEKQRRLYDYRRDPLQARVVEKVETADWTREKIEYQVAGKTVPAWLYLPKGFKRPLPVIHFAPAGDVTLGYRTLPHSIELQLAPLIRGGRAVFAVELEGYLGRPRPAGWVRADPTRVEFVDYMVARVTEMRRGLDYLESRPDIDAKRISLFGISAGDGSGVFPAALEDRYRSVAFVGTGVSSRERDYAPGSRRIDFVPRIRAPKLMLHGRYDEDTSLRSEAEPMFRLMREPKRMEIYEGGHLAPAEIMVPVITKWLDETDR